MKSNDPSEERDERNDPPPNLLGLDRGSLAQALRGVVDRDFRVEQIFRALHLDAVRDFSQITTLPLNLRQQLATQFSVRLPEVRELQTSFDGTRKALFCLADGREVEAVDIPDEGRNTFCLSSQAGCALACRFCVTGYWGAGRDLSVDEIVGQAFSLQESGSRAWQQVNIVLMGMGEPMLNLGAVQRALEVLSEHVPWRRMTLSTAGVLPGIEAMAGWAHRPNLAISLHAPADELRSRLMPINRRYPLADLFDVLHRYPTTRRSALTFEYTLIRDFNDRINHATGVAQLIRGLNAKVNLIPMNPDPVFGDSMQAPTWEAVRAFQGELIARGVRCSVRRPKGDDIAAACGQLRSASRSPRGFDLPTPPPASEGS